MREIDSIRRLKNAKKMPPREGSVVRNQLEELFREVVESS